MACYAAMTFNREASAKLPMHALATQDKCMTLSSSLNRFSLTLFFFTVALV